MKRQSFIRFALVSLALSATASVQAQTPSFALRTQVLKQPRSMLLPSNLQSL